MPTTPADCTTNETVEPVMQEVCRFWLTRFPGWRAAVIEWSSIALFAVAPCVSALWWRQRRRAALGSDLGGPRSVAVGGVGE
jgi:hypothetical protein